MAHNNEVKDGLIFFLAEELLQTKEVNKQILKELKETKEKNLKLEEDIAELQKYKINTQSTLSKPKFEPEALFPVLP